MMGHSCAFCGRYAADCTGGLWYLAPGRPHAYGVPGICVYCARASIRWFGEVPDPEPATAISIFTRLPVAGP